MKPKGIPKKIQTLKKCDPPEENFKELIAIYNKGGLNIDQEMKKKNPNAKKLIPFISVGDPLQVSDTKYKIRNNEQRGNWVYCGDGWYVRKSEEYDFARFLVYNTETKTYEGVWDERLHKLKT